LNPVALRAGRIQELTRLVIRLNAEGIPPKEILERLESRAYNMASPGVAKGYVSEVIRRVSK